MLNLAFKIFARLASAAGTLALVSSAWTAVEEWVSSWIPDNDENAIQRSRMARAIEETAVAVVLMSNYNGLRASVACYRLGLISASTLVRTMIIHAISNRSQTPYLSRETQTQVRKKFGDVGQDACPEAALSDTAANAVIGILARECESRNIVDFM